MINIRLKKHFKGQILSKQVSKMFKQSTFKDDILTNKVKQSELIRQSKFLKEQTKARYVMTKTNIYIFPTKKHSQTPSQIIKISNIISLKSYYKQNNNQIAFRIETEKNSYYLICQSYEQRWSWMTAIEKMIQNDSGDLESLKQTILKENQQKMKRLRQNFLHQRLYIKALKSTFEPSGKQSIGISQEDTKKQLVLHKQAEKPDLPMSVVSQHSQNSQKTDPEQNQHRSSKIQRQNKQQQIFNHCKEEIIRDTFEELFEYLVNQQDGDPKVWVDFIVFICLSKLDTIKPYFLDFCINHNLSRYFKQLFLLLLNEESNERQINNYIRFLILIYQNIDEYFYMSDIKILLDILYRELQLNRQTLQQYLIIQLLDDLVSKIWWKKIDYRRDSLKNILKQLQFISGQQIKDLINDVCRKI